MAARFVAALGVTLAAALAGTAQAHPMEVTGAPCSLTAVADPTAEPGRWTGEVTAGPLAAADRTVGHNPVTITVECSIQVNSVYHQSGASEDDNDAAQAVETRPAVVWLSEPVRFSAQPGDRVYVCTEVALTDATGATERRYLDDLSGGGTGQRGSGEYVTYTNAYCHRVI